MEHELRCWPEYFQSVRDGSKPFELRRDDRGYAVGHTLLLREYDPMTPGYTGEALRVRVTYCLRGGEWLAPGYVCMGIARVSSNSVESEPTPIEETQPYIPHPWLGICSRCGTALNNVSPGFSIVRGGAKVCTPCLRPGEEIARAKGLLI